LLHRRHRPVARCCLTRSVSARAPDQQQASVSCFPFTCSRPQCQCRCRALRRRLWPSCAHVISLFHSFTYPYSFLPLPSPSLLADPLSRTAYHLFRPLASPSLPASPLSARGIAFMAAMTSSVRLPRPLPPFLSLVIFVFWLGKRETGTGWARVCRASVGEYVRRRASLGAGGEARK
jgi:hypothetical protein